MAGDEELEDSQTTFESERVCDTTPDRPYRRASVPANTRAVEEALEVRPPEEIYGDAFERMSTPALMNEGSVEDESERRGWTESAVVVPVPPAGQDDLVEEEEEPSEMLSSILLGCTSAELRKYAKQHPNDTGSYILSHSSKHALPTDQPEEDGAYSEQSIPPAHEGDDEDMVSTERPLPDAPEDSEGLLTQSVLGRSALEPPSEDAVEEPVVQRVQPKKTFRPSQRTGPLPPPIRSTTSYQLSPVPPTDDTVDEHSVQQVHPSPGGGNQPPNTVKLPLPPELESLIGNGQPSSLKKDGEVNFTRLITLSTIMGVMLYLFVHYYWNVEAFDGTSVLLQPIVK